MNTDFRTDIVSFLEAQLIGPAGGENESFSNDLPHTRYMMGILFPQEAHEEQAALPQAGLLGSSTDPDAAEEAKDVADDITIELEQPRRRAGSKDEFSEEDPTFLAGKWQPSSVGVTFSFTGDALDVRVWGASYERTTSQKKEEWHRRPIVEEASAEPVTLRPPEIGMTSRVAVLSGKASLYTLWRRTGDGWLITVSLINDAQRKGKSFNPADCLYQVGLDCVPVRGEIQPYPSATFEAMDPEEDELRLLYRRQLTYAVGHGCAPRWSTDHGVMHVRTAFIPHQEVRPLTQDVPGLRPEILDIPCLATGTDQQATLRDFTEMIDAYEAWIEHLPDKHTDIPAYLHPARDRLRDQMKRAVARMRRGIELLSKNEAWDAFVLANRAMMMQMWHSHPSAGGSRRSRKGALRDVPNTYAPPYPREFRWRPFQLAFILMTLPSLHDKDDADRSRVDLIWFPTGGGKTEAYLLAAAYSIILRRRRHPLNGGGTAVITRYTLRLLTAQQFRRSATLICALERLRRAEPELGLGIEPITIGLWVGDRSTPNNFTGKDGALERFQVMRDSAQPENPFILDACPWCGTEIIPTRKTDDSSAYGVTATETSFGFNCTNPACDFHASLPVQVVDQALYAAPPTFLLGTVDKFAMVAWKSEPGAFFGSGGRVPPELVIQDELHLLSGPLGTTVGLYECALQHLPVMHGGQPKIIASTATIRRASEQVRALFNREVQLFPPSGLDAEDSFFARTDPAPNVKGRTYIGVMSPHLSMKTAMTQLGTVLIEVPRVLDTLPPGVRNSYTTLVTYFNSLRELGQGRKLAQDDITKRLQSLYDRPDNEMFEADQVCELTSNLNGGELTDILTRLTVDPGSDDHIAFLATSNMLSVGVDVSRLGLMLMAGQPKTSSEYIQATSRVGRDAARPGTVVTLYSPGKPRDRSHYEAFPTYHAALYRYVEPSSVTPFALPSRDRALHAVLGILFRHGVESMAAENAAGKFNRNTPEVREIAAHILRWVKDVDSDEYNNTQAHLETLQDLWHQKAEQKRSVGDGSHLHYSSRDRRRAGLYKPYDIPTANALWRTLQNMRSVDDSCEIIVYGS